MTGLVEIIRSDGPVSRSDAVTVFRVLVPIVEAETNNVATEAAGRVIARMPVTDTLTAVLDWWFVVTTGARAPTGTAYHLPDDIVDELRHAMESLLHLGTAGPAAQWVAARRELAAHMSELDDRLELDHYGKSRLPRERDVWSDLRDWIAPVIDSLREGRRADPFELDEPRYERSLKSAGIDRNSRRWVEMIKRAEQMTDFVNGLVELQARAEPWLDRGEMVTVEEVPEGVREQVEPLTELLLRPVLAKCSDGSQPDEWVREAIDSAAAETDDNGRYWLAMVARTWLALRNQSVSSLEDALKRHEAVMRGIERLSAADHDVTAIEVALLDYDIVEAERLLAAETDRATNDRLTDQLRRQVDGVRSEAEGTELADTPEWMARIDRVSRLVDAGDHRTAARELGEVERQLQAVTRDRVLRIARELVDELAVLGAPRPVVDDRRAQLDLLDEEPHRPVEANLLDDLRSMRDDVRRRRSAQATRAVDAARDRLDTERSSLPKELVDEFELSLAGIRSDLSDSRLAAVLDGVEQLLGAIEQHRVHRWQAEEGEGVLVRHLLAYCTQQLHFAPSDVQRLYVALKTKPFVILAGLTGSGKSTIARLMAEAVGASSANGRFRRVAVRPDWIDQSDVLGHVNPISQRFEPGWLAEVARACERDPEHLFVVLLDEMNLAPVEQYLAEYLSAVEEMRSGAIDVRIPLYQRGSQPSNAAEWPHELPFPPNLWMIGTVNIDETTRALSERVLDRANVIQLSVDVSSDHHGSSTDLVQPWVVSYDEWARVCHSDPFDGHHEFLVDIAHTLKEVGIGVGARAHIELERFLANAAGVIDDEDALDLGVLQRIVPKVRGFKRDLVDGLEELRDELESVGCTRCVRVVDRWLDPRTSDDEYIDGTDARIGLVT